MQLYKGIFWIVDRENYENNKNYCFLIPTDALGNNITDMELNAKTGTTFNHEKVWNSLPSRLKFGRPFDHYPRGRVEISNAKATIYANPNIGGDDLIAFVKNVFHLSSENGITEIKTIADGSKHYKCFLDR